MHASVTAGQLSLFLVPLTDFVFPDGLRGVASFLVVLHHTSLLWFTWEIHKGLGATSAANGWLAIFIRLPIIRLLISGLPHVAVFFVISGYAISHRPLSLARQGRYAEVGSTLSSAIFRRHARLFLPAGIITLCTAVMAQFDKHWFVDSGLDTAVPQRVIPVKNTLFAQLRIWVNVEIKHTKPLRHGFSQAIDGDSFNNPYDLNLWTLPIEFTSSIVVFVILAAFTRLRSRARMAFVLVSLIYVEYEFVLWAIFLFLAGMFMCDLRLELEGRAAASSPHSTVDHLGSGLVSGSGSLDASKNVLPLWAREQREKWKVSPIIKKVFRKSTIGYAVGLTSLTVALWLLATPEATMGAKQSWSYARMTSSVTKQYDDHLFVPMGAALLVFTIDHAKFLQSLFTSRLAQYLGRISYSLYLVHGPLLWSLGIKMGRFMLALTGWGTPWRYCVGVFLGMCLWLAVVIFVADLTSRYIDEPCVRFTKWVYNKLSRKEQ